MTTESLSADEARRLGLAAQGFSTPKPRGAVDRRHVRKVFSHVGLIQIDSVNVLVRSQEMPLFARLGPHRRDVLPAMAASVELFEHWAHEASLLPVDYHRLLRWRMEEARQGKTWHGLARLARDHAGYIDAVHAEVRERGPMAASQLSDPGERGGPWWGWNRGKIALEYLFRTGQLAATRSPTFERQYAIAPTALFEGTPVSREEAIRELVARASRSLGVATVNDLADYFRLSVVDTRAAAAQLVEDGRVVATTVEGWKGPAYRWHAATAPRRVNPTALLSPFDSLIWDRKRTERIFGFHYRIEIYTPAPKRIYGYYVLAFLWDGRLVARVDLKADRNEKTLRVPGVFSEIGVPAGPVTEALAVELRTMASWLGLDAVAVGDKGDLARPLKQALRGS